MVAGILEASAMVKLVIQGGKPLEGRIRVAGNKNSALKLMAAALLGGSPSVLTNVPRIRDIQVMGEIMEDLGVKVSGLGTGRLVIDPEGLSSFKIKKELSGRIRTAPLLMAPLLLKFGKAQITTSGGCSLGRRLLSTHFRLLEAMGAEIVSEGNGYLVSFSPKKRKREVFLEEASVTATELGLILGAGVAAETIILDAACEPHVVDLAKMLIKMGAEIEGAGANTIRVRGRRKLKGVSFRVAPDCVEAGSFAIAAAVTRGRITIEGIRKDDLRMICAYFDHLGVKYEFPDERTWKILPSQLKFDARIKELQTRPWPGFPTDLMSPLIVLATQTEGQMVCHDWMYEWRIFFVDDLISMGGNIIIADPHRVIVSGPSRLRGERVVCKDIRAGMAIVIAALAAKGESEVENAEVIERGYERLVERLRGLGAEIRQVS